MSGAQPTFLYFACPRTPSKGHKIDDLRLELRRFDVGDEVIRIADYNAGRLTKTGIVVSLHPQTAKLYVAWKARPKLGSTNARFHGYIGPTALTILKKKGTNS